MHEVVTLNQSVVHLLRIWSTLGLFQPTAKHIRSM